MSSSQRTERSSAPRDSPDSRQRDRGRDKDDKKSTMSSSKHRDKKSKKELKPTRGEVNSWVFPAKTFASPSIEAGMAPEEERKTRRFAYKFISSCGKRLRIPNKTVSKAQIMCQRFYMRESFFNYNFREIGAACLFAAQKDGTPHVYRSLAAHADVSGMLAAHKETPFPRDSKEFLRWTQKIVECESIVLETLCFDINPEDPLEKYAVPYLSELSSPEMIRQACASTIRDSRCTPAFLCFPGKILAVSAILFAYGVHNKPQPEPPLWKRFKVDEKEVVACCEELLTSLGDRIKPN